MNIFYLKKFVSGLKRLIEYANISKLPTFLVSALASWPLISVLVVVVVVVVVVVFLAWVRCLWEKAYREKPWVFWRIQAVLLFYH